VAAVSFPRTRRNSGEEKLWNGNLSCEVSESRSLSEKKCKLGKKGQRNEGVSGKNHFFGGVKSLAKNKMLE